MKPKKELLWGLWETLIIHGRNKKPSILMLLALGPIIAPSPNKLKAARTTPKKYSSCKCFRFGLFLLFGVSKLKA